MEKRQTGKGQPGWKKNDSIELIIETLGSTGEGIGKK